MPTATSRIPCWADGSVRSRRNEALIQHNESPLDTWSENEYALNKVYAFDTVAFSAWLTDLRKEILDDTLAKIDREQS